MTHLRSLLLIVAACGGASKPAVTNTGTAPAPPVVETFTLKRLVNGDRACYVEMTKASGEEVSIEGSFDLCEGNRKDASGLIGKQVTYKTKKANVLAASCEGDMDCGKSDEVDLIIELTAR